VPDGPADFLFISYAWENTALAEWLARKLMAEGYNVWRDGQQMFGGEVFPKVIDQAIKKRTFRVIALLSRFSLNKPSPRKERTLALALARKRGIDDFMIPLNVDGLTPDELPWDYSDLNYVPFQNWLTGFQQLLKKLRAINAPRPLTQQQGRELAIDTFLPQKVLVETTETLYTNVLVFEQIPENLRAYEFLDSLNPAEVDQLSIVWPHYDLAGNRTVAFGPPPAKIRTDRYGLVGESEWRGTAMVEGVVSRNIVSYLLWQSFARTLLKRGLKRTPATGLIYFPDGLLAKNKILYRNRNGRMVPLQVVGERKLRGKPYRYHLAPTFDVRQDLGPEFAVEVKIRIHLTDRNGKTLDKATAFTRRKHLVGNWFNHDWLSRVMAVCSFLARGKPTIRLAGDAPVVLKAVPILGNVSVGIDDAAIAALREQIRADVPGWDEEDEAGEENDAA
jgi:hypothetical protein